MWRTWPESLASWEALAAVAVLLAVAAIIGIGSGWLIYQLEMRRYARRTPRYVPYEQIARRAHQIWEEENGPAGRAEEHSSRAEREFGVIKIKFHGNLRQPYGTPPKILQAGLDLFITSNILSVFVTVIVVLLIAIFSYEIINPYFLAYLKDVATARGLITFLFAVGTIGIFFVMTSAIFVGSLSDAEPRFDRIKDALSMLIGIFGTILGFYFGSAQNSADNLQPGKSDS